MPKILVTGGAGYIGSHVCLLLADNHTPFIVIDNLSRGNKESIPQGYLHKLDLRETEQLHQLLIDHEITDVIHFAALAYVRESIEHPSSYWSNNVVGTHSLLEAMRGTRVRNLVFSSSCATYGIPAQVPIPTTAPQKPINPYGRTKLTCEHLIQDYAGQYKWNVALLRYFNVAGGDPTLRIGETHDPETHLIPSILLRAHHPGMPQLEIYGDDYPTADGSCVRDYVHVIDLARVHVKALDYLENRNSSCVFNVGLGQGTSNFEIHNLCEELTRQRIPYLLKPRNPGDPPILIGDPGGTWKELGLEPLYPSARQMIQHCWQWISSEKRQEWLSQRNRGAICG